MLKMSQQGSDDLHDALELYPTNEMNGMAVMGRITMLCSLIGFVIWFLISDFWQFKDLPKISIFFHQQFLRYLFSGSFSMQ